MNWADVVPKLPLIWLHKQTIGCYLLDKEKNMVLRFELGQYLIWGLGILAPSLTDTWRSDI